MKANTQEAGANVKESGLFLVVGHLEDGDSCQKAHRHLSVEAKVFIRRKENRTKRSRQGVEKFSTGRQAQSIPITQVMVRCGCASSRLHFIRPLCHFDSRVEGQRISGSWDA